ncbi:MAG TPA: hypothetical protein VHP11_14365, partial [Tepidisphaeraceae bacterium]|nr:hypothetical protein [Tepidisphaeraceae bacterium]
MLLGIVINGWLAGKFWRGSGLTLGPHTVILSIGGGGIAVGYHHALPAGSRVSRVGHEWTWYWLGLGLRYSSSPQVSIFGVSLNYFRDCVDWNSRAAFRTSLPTRPQIVPAGETKAVTQAVGSAMAEVEDGAFDHE